MPDAGLVWGDALAGALLAGVAVAVLGYRWSLDLQVRVARAVRRLTIHEGHGDLSENGAIGAALRAVGTELNGRERADARLREQLLAATEQAQALTTISVLLSSVVDGVDEVADRAARLAAEVVGDAAVLEVAAAPPRRYAHHRDPEQLRVLAAASHKIGSLAACFARELDAGEPWVVSVHAKQTLLTRADPGCRDSLRRLGMGSFVAVPLVWGGERVGTLLLLRGEGTAPCTAGDVRMLRDLAARTAVALANARLVSALTEEAARRRRAELAARRALATQRELLERMLDLSRLERRRIAADVHDDAVQVMTAALMQLGTARLQSLDEAGSLARTEELLSTAIGRLRALLFQLAPPDLEAHGLGRSLERLAQDVFAQTTTEVSIDVPEVGVQGEVAEVVFRIVREALLNARKHAAADHVAVRLRAERRGVRVAVSDDGNGLGANRTAELAGHLGVASMSERAVAAGGWLRLGGAERGTTVTFWLPHQRAELSSAGASGGAG